MPFVDDPDAVLADHLSVGFRVSPLWLTSRRPAISGYEQTNRMRRRPRRIYRFNAAEARVEHLREIYQHYNERNGGNRSFPLKDWTDNTATNQLFATGDGTTARHRLRKIYGTYQWEIMCPVEDTLVITANGTPTTAFTIDGGDLTFDPIIGAGVELRWSGDFNVPVKYISDEPEFRVLAVNAEWGDITSLDCIEQLPKEINT